MGRRTVFLPGEASQMRGIEYEARSKACREESSEAVVALKSAKGRTGRDGSKRKIPELRN